MHQVITINDKSRDAPLFRINVSKLAPPVVALPVVGFFFAVFWSVYYNFRASTATHCRVPNYLPSISAAIVYPPPSYIWRICVALHCVPRFFAVVLYYSANKKRRMDQIKKLALYQGGFSKLIAFLNAFELVGLVLLTYVSSQDNKPLHVFSFVSFIGGATFYMFCMCLLHSAMTNETELQWKSLRRKKLCFTIYFLSLLFATYFYHRHNKYCEKGVYTLFALAEYVIVLANMAFHYTFKYDFPDYILKVDETEFKIS